MGPILRSAAASLVALALPPRCPACGAVVDADHRLCGPCWQQLDFIAPPWCAACARPFAFDRGKGAVCAPCLAAPPRHSGVRAAVAYGDVARDVVLKLKYGRRLGHATTIARLLVRHLPVDADLLVPVPLHRGRIWSRGYNQAALIAGALARLGDRPVLPDALIRTRPTPVLRGLGYRDRRRAVGRAFAVADPGAVAGRHVVLVDDVHTTGATTDACTAVLLAAGAGRVTILCWARVLDRDGD